jgi:diguanylate cyclase (GGDEF)-like protein
VSRLEPGSFRVRTIVNVGDLGPTEVRWPQDEYYQLDEFVNLRAVGDGSPLWLADIEDPDCDPEERKLLAELGKGSSLGAPIFVDGQLWGEFYATRHVGAAAFDPLDQGYVEALVAILSGAISRAQREESLEQLAYQDPLTGLLNRRAFDERAAGAFDVPPGTVREVTLLAIDVNGLKHVNDTRGHVAGDRLITAVARALVGQFSRFPHAVVARTGGDEFCVLVTEQEPAVVVEAADELCARVWSQPDGAGVSCGAASAAVTAGTRLTPQALFASADRAQYVAKRGGLCRTVVADSPDGVLEGRLG